MTPRHEESLIEACMIMREAAPDAWQHFVDCFRAFSVVTTSALLRSTPDLLVNNQGRAQGIADLAVLLQQAPERFNEIKNRRRG